MPLYNDINLYYGSSPLTSSLPSPSYYSPFTLPSRTAFSGGTLGLFPPPRLLPQRSGYSPLLPTISETTSLSSSFSRRPFTPLSRIASPRITSSYLPPKPIRIDTADIDVSTPRIPRLDRSKDRDEDHQGISKQGTIKRGRSVVRLHTKRPKDNPALKKHRQTPGERLMEKFLIKDKIAEATKAETQKRQDEQKQLERLQAEAAEAPKPSEESLPIMLTENAALDILVSTQEDEDSCVDELSRNDEKRTKHRTTKTGKDKMGMKKTKKHEVVRRASEPSETLWMMADDPPFDKSPLQRRNTVKKLRRNSQDLSDSETVSCPASRRSSMDVDTPEVILEDTEIKPEKKVTVKRKRGGGKQKFTTNVTVDNNVTQEPILKSPVKFVVDDIQVEETASPSPRTAAKKFRYEITVEDVMENKDKGKENKASVDKKPKKKLKIAQNKKQIPKTPKTADEKGKKTQVKSEKLQEESMKDCITSKSFQTSHQSIEDIAQKTPTEGIPANKEPLSELDIASQTDNNKTIATNKFKDNKLDSSVNRDEGYVSKRRRSDPKLPKIKDKEIQNGMFVAEKKKSPIMTKIIPKMEDKKTGKRVVEKKKRQGDPVISTARGDTPTSPDTEVNFWAFLNSLDDEYQPVTLQKALSLDIVTASNITQNDHKTTPSPDISSLNVEDEVIKESLTSQTDKVKGPKNDKMKEKPLDEKPVPKWKIGKQIVKKKVQDKTGEASESNLKPTSRQQSTTEVKVNDLNMKNESPLVSTTTKSTAGDAEGSSLKTSELIRSNNEDTLHESLISDCKQQPNWKINKLEGTPKIASKSLGTHLKPLLSKEKSDIKETPSSKKLTSVVVPDELKSESTAAPEVESKSQTTYSNTEIIPSTEKAPESVTTELQISDSLKSAEKTVPKLKFEKSPYLPKKNILKPTAATDISSTPIKSTKAVDLLEKSSDEDFWEKINSVSTQENQDQMAAQLVNKSKDFEKHLEIDTKGNKEMKKIEVTEKTEHNEKPCQHIAKLSDTKKEFEKQKSSKELVDSSPKIETSIIEGAKLNQQKVRPQMKTAGLPIKTKLESPTEKSKFDEKETKIKLQETEEKIIPKWKVRKQTEEPKHTVNEDTLLEVSPATSTVSEKIQSEDQKLESPEEKSKFDEKKTRVKSPGKEEKKISKPKVKKQTEEHKETVNEDALIDVSSAISSVSENVQSEVQNQEMNAETDVVDDEDFWGAITGTATIAFDNVTETTNEISSEVSPESNLQVTPTIKTPELPKPKKKVVKVKTGKIPVIPKTSLEKRKSKDEKKTPSSDTAVQPDESFQKDQSRSNVISPAESDSATAFDAISKVSLPEDNSKTIAVKETDKNISSLSSPLCSETDAISKVSLLEDSSKTIAVKEIDKNISSVSSPLCSEISSSPSELPPTDKKKIESEIERTIPKWKADLIKKQALKTKTDNALKQSLSTVAVELNTVRSTGDKVDIAADNDLSGKATKKSSSEHIKEPAPDLTSQTPKLSSEPLLETEKCKILEPSKPEEKKVPKWKFQKEKSDNALKQSLSTVAAEQDTVRSTGKKGDIAADNDVSGKVTKKSSSEHIKEPAPDLISQSPKISPESPLETEKGKILESSKPEEKKVPKWKLQKEKCDKNTSKPLISTTKFSALPKDATDKQEKSENKCIEPKTAPESKAKIEKVANGTGATNLSPDTKLKLDRSKQLLKESSTDNKISKLAIGGKSKDAETAIVLVGTAEIHSVKEQDQEEKISKPDKMLKKKQEVPTNKLQEPVKQAVAQELPAVSYSKDSKEVLTAKDKKVPAMKKIKTGEKAIKSSAAENDVETVKDTDLGIKTKNDCEVKDIVTTSESVTSKDSESLKPTVEVNEDKKIADSGKKPKKIVKVKKGAKTLTNSNDKIESIGTCVPSEDILKKDVHSEVNKPDVTISDKDGNSESEAHSGTKDIEQTEIVVETSSPTSIESVSTGDEKKSVVKELPEVMKKEEASEDDDATSSESTQRSSMSSDDSGFDSLPTSKAVPSSSSSEGREPTSPSPSLASNPCLDPYDDGTESSRTSWHSPPAASLPRFRKYTVEDFQFLKLLGKGSFGKVLLAELKGTDRYYAVKCLKKDVVLEDDDVECTLIERKVLALGTKHPYLCHLFCTFQTESHLLFVMEYLNGGDLMFHIQQSGRFPEPRARFYAAEIVCGLKFLHKKGIVYRDLKLDNILLDFEGHVRIADFGMCKLQIFLERTADTFCGTPDYMAPEIIKGLKYNQCVDWWSFGVLLFEMLVGVSPFNGCDEDDLFWSICNEQPHYPLFLSRESNSILTKLLEKDASKRLGTPNSGTGDVTDHVFFRSIDWVALEHRELDPPFKPRVQHPLDVQYFDTTFTQEKAVLTPIDKGILQSMDQTQFQGFSYTNPNATD